MGAYCDDFEENWLHYNGTALYLLINVTSLTHSSKLEYLSDLTLNNGDLYAVRKLADFKENTY